MAIARELPEVDKVGVFEPGTPSIDPLKLLRIHGYKDMDKVRPIIRKTADVISKRAAGVMTSIVYFRRVPIADCDADGLKLANGLAFENHAFAHYLSGAAEVVVVIITVGKGLDDEVIGCMDDDEFEPLEALFLETAGWLGIESATKSFVNHLSELVGPEGLRPTQRMGPGYSYKVDGDLEMWSLEDQRQLFEVFDGVDLPVRLLESCAMLPKMSRSGLYGLVN
ncbi:MAG: hypothetical protein P8M79_10190 [Alphaproteobacteria bacterium]|nr:hypothetical protein [Alphaproteobacteria bacterium]